MQGPGGVAAPGRMAAVAMVYNAGVPGAVRYVSGLSGGLDALAEPLRLNFLPEAEARALQARLGREIARNTLRW